jgi:hypothetical protein
VILNVRALDATVPSHRHSCTTSLRRVVSAGVWALPSGILCFSAICAEGVRRMAYLGVHVRFCSLICCGSGCVPCKVFLDAVAPESFSLLFGAFVSTLSRLLIHWRYSVAYPPMAMICKLCKRALTLRSSSLPSVAGTRLRRAP